MKKLPALRSIQLGDFYPRDADHKVGWGGRWLQERVIHPLDEVTRGRCAVEDDDFFDEGPYHSSCHLDSLSWNFKILLNALAIAQPPIEQLSASLQTQSREDEEDGLKRLRGVAIGDLVCSRLGCPDVRRLKRAMRHLKILRLALN